MKKIILTALSFILVISCFVFHAQTEGLMAGAGSGVNERVENVEDLADVLLLFSNAEVEGIDLLFDGSDEQLAAT